MGRLPRVTRRKAVVAAAGLSFLVDLVVRRRSARRLSEPGLLIVQVDGLGLPALGKAIERGNAPFLGGLISRGDVVLQPWFALLPPTTPASQAGILHGHNDDIPGFRWYEKAIKRLLVANHAGDAAEIARRQSDGHGLLAPDGASVGNLMTGDARRTYLTMATVAEEPRAPGTLIRLRTFLLSPINAVRILAGMVGEFAVELYQGRRQVLRRVWPRMHRGFDSASERAVLNGAVRILSTELVLAEMRMGTPIIYVDFTGYDSVAHHSGPDRPESLRAVRGIDGEIERILAKMARARRPYQLVVLSDHGQSLGRPFQAEYGATLEQFIAGAMGADVPQESRRETEHGHGGGLLARELLVLLGAGPGSEQGAQQPDPPELVVCASGNLAHVYFTIDEGRLTKEAIEQHYPGLLNQVLHHPAVGCVLVRSSGGALAISRTGQRSLDGDQIEGEDPLVPYGPLAVQSLRRLDGFSNVGDLVLLSTLDPVTSEVISFEDLVGCHGGLGGAQAEPFILHPSGWSAAEGPLVGAPSVNRQLRTWLAELHGQGSARA